jgi:hypothetical protein
VNFFRRTREAIGHFWLKHLLKRQNREVRLKAIGQIKTAAIIFDASSENNYQQAREFAQHLIANQTEVKALGYIDGHKQQMPYIGDQTYCFVTLKDFSFFFLPKKPAIKELVVTPFDTLFVLTARSFFPLKAFTSLSAAHLKVGFTGIWEEAMDLTFDLPNHNSEELVKQINYYLGTIKTV